MAPTSEEAKLLKALLEEVKHLNLAMKRIEQLLAKKARINTIDVTTYADPDAVPLEG
jgi:hypothetical protein